MLVEELAGLLNASVEQRPVLHNELDILDGQVNEHTSDLGGLGADDLLDELVEDCANLVLVVGVLGHDGVEYLPASHQVALVDCQMLYLLHMRNNWLQDILLGYRLKLSYRILLQVGIEWVNRLLVSEGPATDQNLILLIHRSCKELWVRNLELLH